MQPFVKHVRVENPSATIRFRATAVARNHPRLSEIFKQPFLRGIQITRIPVMLLRQATHPRLFEILTVPFYRLLENQQVDWGDTFF